MSVSRLARALALPILCALSACYGADPSKDDLDCLALGGGYEGADTAALQAECEADPRGTGCEAADFIQSDAAKCIAVGEWSEAVDEDYVAVLSYSYGYRTVLWGVFIPGDGVMVIVEATSGASHWAVYYAPEK
jgi:hypothetical protein